MSFFNKNMLFLRAFLQKILLRMKKVEITDYQHIY